MRMQSAPHVAEPGPAAQAAARRLAEYKAALQNDVLPDDVEVRLDAEAGRFVSTLTDSQHAARCCAAIRVNRSLRTRAP